LEPFAEHSSSDTHPLIFISAAEPSADLHGASLIHATLARRPEARFVGVAGPRMVAQGCQPIFNMTRHSAMLLGALRAGGQAVAMLTTSERHLHGYPFDAAVVIDSPTLHLPLAKRAQATGVPVMYYIAPQLWAWGAYRIHRLRARVDRVAVILPFEEKYFRDQGVNATYVGHPLAETFASTEIDQSVVDEIRAVGSPVVALLPGSRRHVVEEILRGQLEIAQKITSAFPRATFGVSVANPQVAPMIESLRSACRVPLRTYPDGHDELIRAADLVLVASGTTTLEVAFHEKPMIVMYNASRIFYHLIARWMIHTPYLSLPNILGNRAIVPEFMPYYTSTDPIAKQAIELLESEQRRRAMAQELSRLVEPLRAGRASERTAELLLDMIDHSGH
jgi:lipid-A-disaccharide synthase